MKKSGIVILIFAFMIALSGCSSGDYIAVTDEESDAIAQYCAYLLLKYDKNKNDDRKLLDIKELEDIYKAEQGEEEVTPIPSPTPTEEPEPTDSPKPTKKPKATETPTPSPSKDENTITAPPVDDANKAKSLTEVYPGTGFEVEFVSFKMGATLSEDENFTIRPTKEGYAYLSGQFKISNTKGGIIDVDFVGAPIKYMLYCDNGDVIAEPEIGIKDDLQFYSAKLAGTSSDAVLLFSIKDDTTPFLLRVTNTSTGKTYDITLKKKKQSKK